MLTGGPPTTEAYLGPQAGLLWALRADGRARRYKPQAQRRHMNLMTLYVTWVVLPALTLGLAIWALSGLYRGTLCVLHSRATRRMELVRVLTIEQRLEWVRINL